jgi:hypothetical protein
MAPRAARAALSVGRDESAPHRHRRPAMAESRTGYRRPRDAGPRAKSDAASPRCRAPQQDRLDARRRRLMAGSIDPSAKSTPGRAPLPGRLRRSDHLLARGEEARAVALRVWPRGPRRREMVSAVRAHRDRRAAAGQASLIWRDRSPRAERSARSCAGESSPWSRFPGPVPRASSRRARRVDLAATR